MLTKAHFISLARNEKYQSAITKLLETGNAYYCYCSKDELDTMRETAMARGEKPKYDRQMQE